VIGVGRRGSERRRRSGSSESIHPI
jgi:hypothetical protein